MNQKKKTTKTKYLEDLYKSIRMRNLIIFGIHSVLKNSETCTYESLVAECFQYFPKVFGFKIYPQWPDSLKFDRVLRALRAQGLIVGSVRGHFELTKSGMKIAKDTESILNTNFLKFMKKEGQNT